jgi:hypothetical protein
MKFNHATFRENLDEKGVKLSKKYHDLCINALSLISEDQKFYYNNSIEARGDVFQQSKSKSINETIDLLNLIGEYQLARYVEEALDGLGTMNEFLYGAMQQLKKQLQKDMPTSKFNKISPALKATFVQACNEFPPNCLEKEIVEKYQSNQDEEDMYDQYFDR